MRTVEPVLTRPAVGWRSPATRDSSVDFPDPLAPRMPVRSPGAMRHSTSSRTCLSPKDTETSSRSTTSLPRRAVARRDSSTRSRGGGTSAMRALAASMRNFGLEVRAGAPRRSQASSFFMRFCRLASAEAACRSRSTRCRTYAA